MGLDESPKRHGAIGVLLSAFTREARGRAAQFPNVSQDTRGARGGRGGARRAAPDERGGTGWFPQVSERCLMVLRAAALAHGSRWCFPGGHVERGESSEDAVVRELEEELSIRVRAVELLGEVVVPRYRLDAWRVEHVSGDVRPNPAEVADWRFMTRQEIASLTDGLPSNAQVMALLETARRA